MADAVRQAQTQGQGASRLTEFIRYARDDLTALSSGGAWKSDRWEHNGPNIVFSTGTAPTSSYSWTPMTEPYKQFAKAYVRHRYSQRPVKNLSSMLMALRCIEAGLLSACGHADISRLNGAVMDVCAEKCREFYVSADVRCQTGRHIQAVFDFLRSERIVPSLPAWKSPFKKPVILTEDLGPAGQTHRESKLPSNATMLMVADLFAQADDIESRYFSSILILLMATFSRVSEVLNLSTDCLQWEPDELGTPQMYLRWWAAKGKGATKKWILPPMQDVASEAVTRLLEIGEPARMAARFAYENPGQYLHQTDSNDSRPLSPPEFYEAIGSHDRAQDRPSTITASSIPKGMRKLVDGRSPSYCDLANYVMETYQGRHWPYIDEAETTLTWQALCLVRDRELHKTKAVMPFSWRLPNTNNINSRFGSHIERSLFEKHGFRNADGTPIALTTHQVRHWLSTMSERAGMDDYTLAQWAGRARINDNRHYDHRSPEERLEAANEILKYEQPPLLERFKNRQPVTYEELGVDRPGTAKATLYGMCVHDYAMAPCQKQRECMTCKEHVCIKGDHVTLERIQLLEQQTETLLRRAQEAHEDGYFGADRWVDNHKWKLAHVRAMRMKLEEEGVPDGTAWRIPKEHDPSAVHRALLDLELIGPPEPDTLALPMVPVALGTDSG